MNQKQMNNRIKKRRPPKNNQRIRTRKPGPLQQPNNKIAGPSVINKKSSEGGYLAHFKNESKVVPGTSPDQGTGSP